MRERLNVSLLDAERADALISILACRMKTAAGAPKHAALDARPWVAVVTMKAPHDLPQAFDALRGMGIERISCIGGRTLAGHLLDANLVEDVYLTTGTREGGRPGTPMYEKPWRGAIIVRKHGTGPETGVVFEHIRRP
jgi:riboflavin biosynthesis pyrimidine reductase